MRMLIAVIAVVVLVVAVVVVIVVVIASVVFGVVGVACPLAIHFGARCATKVAYLLADNNWPKGSESRKSGPRLAAKLMGRLLLLVACLLLLVWLAGCCVTGLLFAQNLTHLQLCSPKSQWVCGGRSRVGLARPLSCSTGWLAFSWS